MSYTLKTNISNRSNYGSARSTDKIKYIVIHYTANDGDTDESNGKYFHNNVVKASAHYFVDSDSVTQSVPDNYVAWSVGGSKYSNCATTGGGKYYGTVTNTNSISIELCDDKNDGKIYPSEATINNALELTRTLMNKYGIPRERVIRHFDVTGKSCPSYWCGSAEKNELWRSEFYDRICAAESDTEQSYPLLKKGSEGDYVKELQSILCALGYTLEIDGSFGPATLAAVIAFQKAQGLDTDGIVGENTWTKLYEEMSLMAKFNDTEGHWAEETIDELAEMGIVHGYENGNFEPDANISRAEAATMIRNAVKYITGK